MDVKNIGLHNHLTIYSLVKKENNEKVRGKSHTVLINPSSYSINHSAHYVNNQPINGESKTELNAVKKQSFTLELLFDSTGSLGNITEIENKSVLEQIGEFMSIASVEKTENSKKKFVELIWGKMHFECVLTNVGLNYSHFDAMGDPIRATASCNFLGDEVTFDKVEGGIAATEVSNKVLNYANMKHAINGVMEHGSYLSILAIQPKPSLPKSLRIKEEIAKMIIK